jgi:hypothetical protein
MPGTACRGSGSVGYGRRIRSSIVHNARYRLGVDTLTADDYRIEPLSMRTWDAFADLAQRHNGVWGGCWCTYFHLHPDPKEERRALGHRELKRRLVEGREQTVGVHSGRFRSWGTPCCCCVGDVSVAVRTGRPDD